jgi:Tol biopolymer transport system component
MTRTSRRALYSGGLTIGLLAAGLAAPSVETAGAAVADTTRVSVAANGTQGNQVSFAPSLSANGRYVAFMSDATNLVPGDSNGKGDVFVRDRVLNTVSRVSVSSAEAQGNGNSDLPSISPDGRWVAFMSDATNLVAGDTNGQTDAFLRDRKNGVTFRVSISNDEHQATGGASTFPMVSANGRYVTFASAATNLVNGDTNGLVDVFIRDRLNNTTSRVSVTSGEAQAVGGDSGRPAMTPDARFIAFQSDATNLVGGDTNGHTDVFVRDRQNGTTNRVSVSGTEAQAAAPGFSGVPSISSDGRFVAFHSTASNLVPGDTNATADVFVRDRKNGATLRVSRADNNGPQGNGDSLYPVISANGRFVAFGSNAPNLVAGDSNGVADVFVRDRLTSRTKRISVSTGGAEGNDESYGPAMTPDGRFVAYNSRATNLVSGDTNGKSDVFMQEVLGTCQGRVATIVGTPGDDVIKGTNGDDVIIGGDGNDIIRGRRGHDVICGQGGNDKLVGRAGRDILVGGNGDDILNGGKGRDRLFGGKGDDRLSGGKGRDTLKGGKDNDLLRGGRGNDTCSGGRGDDTLVSC